jgi:biopolymer transport protein ExbD
MGKRDRGNSVNLDSFLDIMTCILGILILMVLLTGIDASQIRIAVTTPMEYLSDKKPVFVECRNNELFVVPLEELHKVAEASLKQIAKSVTNDSGQLIRKLAETKVQNGAYIVDLNSLLLGQLTLQAVPNVTGYRLVDIAHETPDDWYGRILAKLDKQKEMLSFIVRDDSFEVFKRARAMAGKQQAEVSYELIDANEPIKFGLGGSIPMPQ